MLRIECEPSKCLTVCQMPNLRRQKISEYCRIRETDRKSYFFKKMKAYNIYYAISSYKLHILNFKKENIFLSALLKCLAICFSVRNDYKRCSKKYSLVKKDTI